MAISGVGKIDFAIGLDKMRGFSKLTHLGNVFIEAVFHLNRLVSNTTGDGDRPSGSSFLALN